MMNKDNITIIGNSHGWSERYIREAGFNFVDAYKNHGMIYRIIREFFFRLRLPGKSLFYNKNAICADKILIVGDSLITYEYMEWLYKKCPTCKILLKYYI